ncbi:MAG: DNA polymerase I, partial [Clostridia bacterium]|nr:DNA polymerase I [Clostridia bacterium]
LADADYSQIELRVLAHISEDKNMIDAFLKNEDIHRVTAAQVLGIPQEAVTKEQRSSAKAVNFGIVYGMGEYSLSQDLKISVKQAKEYIESYLEKYSGVLKYMESIKEQARKNGYVETMLKRRRDVPEIESSNFNTRAFGERVALNTPIQGTAADIIKLAMVRIYRRLKEEGFRARLILQVHDELIIESPEEELSKVKTLLKTEMENAVTLRVPLVCNMSEGKSWYDAK